MLGDRIAAVALTLLAAVMAWQSTKWPEASEFAGDPVVMPRALAMLMVITAISLAFGRRSLPEKVADARPWRVLTGAALTVALALLLATLGLIAAGIPYLIALMRVTRASWRTAIPVAIITPFVLWLVFEVWLNVPLPSGDLWARLAR